MNLPRDVVIVSKNKLDSADATEGKKKQLLPFSSLAGGELSKSEAIGEAELKQVQSFTVEKNDSSMGNERLIIGDQKFLYIMPD